jgi:hypothetical protein
MCRVGQVDVGCLLRTAARTCGVAHATLVGFLQILRVRPRLNFGWWLVARVALRVAAFVSPIPAEPRQRVNVCECIDIQRPPAYMKWLDLDLSTFRSLSIC